VQDGVEERLVELSKRYPEQAVVWADLGQLALAQGGFQQSARHFRRALQLQPQANRLHYPLAMALRGLGSVEEATGHLRQQGERDVSFDDPLYERMQGLSNSYSYYMSKGLQAARSGEYEIARNLLEKAVDANPEDGLARINHARMLVATDQMDLARSGLQQWLQDNPDNATAWLELGIMEEMLKNDQLAVGHYLAAVQNDGRNFRAWLLAANASMRLGQYAEAATQYRKALTLRPERTELLLQTAMAQQAAGQCLAAIETLYELVSKLPEEIEVLMAYTRVAATCPNIDARHRANGLNAARNIYAMAPRLSAIITLAMIEAASGNYEAAADYQSQAIFMALRDGQQDQQDDLVANLELFRSGKPAQSPWPETHPLLHPRRMTAADRKQNR
jgi:tetratricopeptide (TPR) repeat protein